MMDDTSASACHGMPHCMFVVTCTGQHVVLQQSVGRLRLLICGNLMFLNINYDSCSLPHMHIVTYDIEHSIRLPFLIQHTKRNVAQHIFVIWQFHLWLMSRKRSNRKSFFNVTVPTFLYFYLWVITQVKIIPTTQGKYFIQWNKAIVILKPLWLY